MSKYIAIALLLVGCATVHRPTTKPTSIKSVTRSAWPPPHTNTGTNWLTGLTNITLIWQVNGIGNVITGIQVSNPPAPGWFEIYAVPAQPTNQVTLSVTNIEQLFRAFTRWNPNPPNPQ